ncbi:MAG TPA: glycosyltransferase [Pyrinomonadaceae bacterium]|nr:glycosyltransferase [Pyrinomonadaceae bacterium]
MVHPLGPKKRIVFTTWGSYGDIHPHMALALELKSRGHHPVIATSSIYRDKIEAEGLEFIGVRPDLPEPASVEAAEMIRKVSDTVFGPAYLFRELLMPHVRDTYADTLEAVTTGGGADLLVSHQVPLTAPIVAEKTGVKWISSVLFPIAFASAYDPPTPPQFPAIRSLVVVHPILGQVLMDIGKWTMQWWVEPLQDLRKEVGLSRGSNPIFEGQHSPRLVLGLFSSLLSKIEPDFPPNTVLTGFVFYDRDDPGRPVPQEMERFLNEGDPPIVFTLGSSLPWLSNDFYKIAIEASQRLGKRAVLLTGDKRNLPDGSLPEGIMAFDYAPHNRLMPRSICTVHQGGIGTTGQALRAGRPMIVVPHGQDQPDNARRCVELGVARSIPAAGLSVDRLVQELAKLLADPAYSTRSIEVGEKVSAENGTETACDLIEDVLNGGDN